VTGSRVVLGSGSPRRLELLRAIGVEPRVVSPDIDESVLPNERPVDYVRRLASAKLDAVMREVGAVSVGAVVIAADTTVEIDGQILGKPVDDAEAMAMLMRLRGREHRVHTGFAVAVAGPGCRGVDWDGHVDVVTSTVVFREVPIVDLIAYVDSGEPRDKAGAYAIQGGAAGFVERLDGDLDAVIGLPVARVASVAASLGASLHP
jgi:septum formation protein